MIQNLATSFSMHILNFPMTFRKVFYLYNYDFFSSSGAFKESESFANHTTKFYI